MFTIIWQSFISEKNTILSCFVFRNSQTINCNNRNFRIYLTLCLYMIKLRLGALSRSHAMFAHYSELQYNMRCNYNLIVSSADCYSSAVIHGTHWYYWIILRKILYCSQCLLYTLFVFAGNYFHFILFFKIETFYNVCQIS